MDKAGDIKLDPDISEDGYNSRMPLSDFYEIPVFSADSEHKISEYHTEKEKRMRQIRQNIFKADERRKEEEIKDIRSRIFQASNISAAAEVIEKPEEETGLIFQAVMIVCMIILLISSYIRAKVSAFGKTEKRFKRSGNKGEGKNRDINLHDRRNKVGCYDKTRAKNRGCISKAS